MTVLDHRAGFVWQSLASLDHLRAEWEPTSPSLSAGLATYVAMCELANDQRVRGAIGEDSHTFRAIRSDISDLSGVGERVTADALKELARIGLIGAQSGKAEGLANAYLLLEPGGMQQLQTPPQGVQPLPGGSATTAHSLDREKKEEPPVVPRGGPAIGGAEEFDAWVADYREVMGKPQVTGTKAAKRAFKSRRREDITLDDLKLATRGCASDTRAVTGGWNMPEHILRAANVQRYIELGRGQGDDDFSSRGKAFVS